MHALTHVRHRLLVLSSNGPGARSGALRSDCATGACAGFDMQAGVSSFCRARVADKPICNEPCVELVCCQQTLFLYFSFSSYTVEKPHLRLVMPPQKRKSEQDCAAPSEAEQLAAFRRCAPADEDKARSLLPQVVSTMELLSSTQCVDWSWLLLAAAAGVPQLSPRDRLQLCESILIPGSIWACLIHPGATNTSGIIKMVTKAWELIYARRNAVEEAAALAEARAQMASQEGGDAPAKVVAPPKRKGLAGGGSLAAAGFAASQTQNRGAMFAVEPEVHGIISWLAQESAIDKAVPGKLWDHVTWDRPVMSSGKGFCVQEPFFSFVAGGHIPELVEALESDWFGLRQRLTVLFAPPTWLRLRDIKAACHKLPPETGFKPEVFLSALLYPLFHWSLDRDRALALEGKPPEKLVRSGLRRRCPGPCGPEVRLPCREAAQLLSGSRPARGDT